MGQTSGLGLKYSFCLGSYEQNVAKPDSSGPAGVSSPGHTSVSLRRGTEWWSLSFTFSPLMHSSAGPSGHFDSKCSCFTERSAWASRLCGSRKVPTPLIGVWLLLSVLSLIQMQKRPWWSSVLLVRAALMWVSKGFPSPRFSLAHRTGVIKMSGGRHYQLKSRWLKRPCSW